VSDAAGCRQSSEADLAGFTSIVTNQANLPIFMPTEIRTLAKCGSHKSHFSSLGFKARELREIERLVSRNGAILLKAWEEFHG
jgi:hypothetical protein